ncbi:MAG: CBS domain-containing protein [Parasphingorhabdus sp.]|nr:CBS domain-containing protein [Parasphingorhabdus sp.]
MLGENGFGSLEIGANSTNSAGCQAKSTPLSPIMASEVKTASPDDQLIHWLRQMSDERFRHLQVVDSAGRLINLLSQGDFGSFTWPELLLNLRDKARETIRGNFAPVRILIGSLLICVLIIFLTLKFLQTTGHLPPQCKLVKYGPFSAIWPSMVRKWVTARM